MSVSMLSTKFPAARLFNPKLTPPRQAWVENFIGEKRQLIDIIDLHPKVFGVFPRIDHVSNIVQWQQSYREIDYTCMPTRNELPGGTKKPWPQKGTGRARHRSVNSPIFLKGGWVHGPRGPVTGFRIKPHFHLVNALRAMLTIKLAQDDLKIVDNINTFTTGGSNELEEKFNERGWGPSVLIIDHVDEFPENLAQASSELNHVNLMPTYGLNTLSMCKHETMVITVPAIRHVEEKLLFQLARVDLNETHTKYRGE